MKYGAKKTRCAADHLHDSKLEAGRCDQLSAMEGDGTITHLVQQPEFKCQIDGKLVCTYRADHGYRMADSGLQIVEDTKGKTTPVFNLKKKLVEAIYPGTVITVWPPRIRKKRKTATRKAA
jgi:hypothetical protein